MVNWSRWCGFRLRAKMAQVPALAPDSETPPLLNRIERFQDLPRQRFLDLRMAGPAAITLAVSFVMKSVSDNLK